MLVFVGQCPVVEVRPTIHRASVEDPGHIALLIGEAATQSGTPLVLVADAAVRMVADDVAADAVAAIRGWRFQRSHGATADGAVAAVEALRQRRARMLLVSDEPSDRRRAWFGTDPAHLAIDLEDASASLPAVDLESGRLADVLIRSALLQALPVTMLPSLPSSTLGGGIGVLVEDSTP